MTDETGQAVSAVSHATPDHGVINCVAYHRGVRMGPIELANVREALKEPDTFIWIGLVDADAPLLRAVQIEFGLHDLAVEDALHGHQRPKLEQYDDSLFVVLRTVELDRDAHLISGETHVFVGRQYVLTVRRGSSISHVNLRTRCEAIPAMLSKGPAFVLYALMDFVVDHYFPVVDSLEDELEHLEAEIFNARSGSDTMRRIYDLKRDLLAMKRAVAPLVEVCGRLTRFDIELVDDTTRTYFRDVHDHTVRINDMIDTLSQLMSTALEANLGLISVAQNEDTKRLAAWAAIIAVPTLLAGLYGMNFEFMPELHWRFGYPLFLGVMATACTWLYVAFKRSKWL